MKKKKLFLRRETDDEFGKLNDVAINGATISITNDDTFTLTRNSDQEIGQGMFFKIVDSSDLRYYPYVEQALGNVTNVSTITVPTTSADNNTSVVTPVENNTSVTPVEGGAPAVNGTETTTPTAEEATNSTAQATNNTTSKPSPGFGIFPAIVGLLVVIYLVRKQR